MSLFSFLFWWERSCQPVKCWSAARPQEEDLQPWPEEKVWKERLQQLRQDWETKRLCKMQVTSHFFFLVYQSPSQNHWEGPLLHCLSSVTCLSLTHRHWRVLMYFLPALGFTSFLLILSLMSLHVIHCTGYPCQVLAAGRGLQGQPLWGKGWGCSVPEKASSQLGTHLSPSASQVTQWRRGRSGRRSSRSPAAPGGSQAGADIHTAAHEGNIGYFLKELHPMDNCW